MLDDFVEAKRGGICGVVGERYININNSNISMSKHIRRSIWYIDADNLYGYAMMQMLPYKGFGYYQGTCFADSTSLDEIINTPDDNYHGYYIVCDIKYTNSCKDITEQLALMPNKRKVNDDELGYRERDGGKAISEKLILDQNNKTKYMVHYRMLKFYVKMGVEVTKIHRVINFK